MKSTLRWLLAIVALGLLVVGGATGVQAATNYVTVTGTGSGADWANATSLTNALRISQSNDVIWLEQGTYTNTATFTVVSNNVSLYGGFTNGMATLAERNWTSYPTLLDGKAQDRRVVTVSGANVLLDGLIISNSYGSAAGGITKTTAGALTLANCRIVRHEGRTTFMKGLGVYVTAGSVLMTNCVVARNTISGTSAYDGFGFGIYSKGADLQVVDCSLSDHYGDGNDTRSAAGVGLWFDQGNLQVLRTVFTNNAAGANNFYSGGGGGSAVYLGNNASFSAVFSNCVFRGNAGLGGSGQGAGAVVWAEVNSAKTAAFVNCTFAYNTNYNGNGGSFYVSSGTVELRNSLLWSNTVTAGGTTGREVYMAGGTLRARYSGITGTTLPHVYVSSGSLTLSPVMTNDPLFASATDLHVKSVAGRWQNGSWVNDTVYSPAIDAGDPGDGVGGELSENGARVNLGAYAGTAEASKSPSPEGPKVANRSVLTNAYTQMILRGELTNSAAVLATVGICYGTNSITDETTNGWQYVTQFYPPQQTGTVFSVTTSFLLTNTTYYYRTYATNAYGGSWAPVDSFTTVTNYPPLWGVGGGADVIHVRSAATGEGDGRDWHNAYTTIGAGIAAISGTRTNIWITGATYAEGLQRTLSSSAVLVGGFVGGETAVSQRPTNSLGVVTNYTVMNGAATHVCLSISAASAGLDAMIFSNSVARSLTKSGTGTLTLNNCQTRNNSGTSSGVGAYLSGGTVRLYGCRIADNNGNGGGNTGGGIHFDGCTALMTNCVVSGNRVGFGSDSHSGAGIGIYGNNACNLEVVDCVFSNNVGHNNYTRHGRGSGLAFDGSGALRVRGTEFVGNVAVGGGEYGGNLGGGGAVYLGNSATMSAVFSNCLFRTNVVQATPTAGGGGAVQVKQASTVTSHFVNCSFAFNGVDGNGGRGGALLVRSGTVNLMNCIARGNVANTGNVAYVEAGAANISYSMIDSNVSPSYVYGTVDLSNCLMGDPLFASGTDLHLQSVAGRWNPATSAWVKDTAMSPCIDAGTGAAGNEPEPNGGIINLGAYGGTWQASKSATPPVITNGALVEISMNEDAGPLSLAALGLAATDQCDTAWAWTNVAGSGPANGTVAVNGTGTNPTWTAFTYNPSGNFNGTNTFDVKVTGLTALLSDTVTVRVVVNPVNDPPANTVPSSYTGTTFEVMTQWGVNPGTWNDNLDTNAVYDGSGLTFTYQWYCSNSPSSFAIANATNATYTPGSEWLGSNLTVEVTCSDTGYLGSSAATLTPGWSKVLDAANTPPVIQVNGVPADSVSTNMNEDGGALSLTGLGLSATDDGNGGSGVAWTNFNNPSYGTVSVNGSGTDVVNWISFSYTPATNFVGTDSFVVQAKDAVNATDSITVTVVVAAVNDPPLNTVPPGFTGSRLVGTAVTATNGVWNDNIDTNGSYTAANFESAATFTYQWYRSANADGSGSNAIASATASSYTLTEDDKWKYLSVAVTCTDGNYPAGSSSNTAFSAWLRETTTPPVYVTTNGTGGGLSWADATSLTNALRVCVSNSLIWIEQGTYTNTATFTVASNNVTLYGGFTNGMATLAERNWTVYPTILDGKAQDRRVVTVSGANVILDGLIISNSYGAAAGGLTKTTAGALTVANCRLVNHEGRTTDMRGIGASFTNGPVLLTNCVVANNTISGSAWNGQGFGVYAKGADLQVVDCLFTNQYGNYNDTRTAMGLGLYFDQGNLQVLRSSFVNNSGGVNNLGGGSAICLGNSATFSATISNCIFRGNVGLYLNANNSAGAALWANLGAGKTATVVNCTFKDNTNQEGDGGAIRLSGGTLVLRNSILWTNVASQAARYGHEINVAGGALQASYCLLGGLSTPQIYVSSGSATLSNCATNNPLYASATDLHVQSPAGRWNGTTFVFTDTAYSPAIDAGDPADQVGAEVAQNGARVNLGAYGGTDQASKSPEPAAPLVANRSVLTNAYTSLILRGELTNSAVLFATVGICYGTNSVAGESTNGWQSVTQFYPPYPTGVVFTVTTPYLLTNTTYYYRAYATNAYGGSWAPVDSFVTPASYPPGWGVGGGADVIHVRAGAVGEADGRDWYNAYTTIGAGLAAIGGTRTNVWVAGGTYSEGIKRSLATNAMVVGGFSGVETSVSQRPTNALGVATNYTVMNGAATYVCLEITAGNVGLDAMIFSNSVARALTKSGTGTLTLNNCQTRNNSQAGVSGVGAYLSGGTVRLTGCRIENNSGSSHGCGAHFNACTAVLTNCIVAGNVHGSVGDGPSSYGFGVYANGGCTMDIVDCVFSNQVGHLNNSRSCRGAGLAVDSGTLGVSRTDFIGNRGVGHPDGAGPGGGGALYLGNSATLSAQFSNCLFRANQVMKTTAGGGTPGWGGAVQANMTSVSTASFVNCTFAFNTNAYGNGGAFVVVGGTAALKNTIVWTNGLTDLAFTGYDFYVTNASAFVTASHSDFTGTNAPHVVAAGGGTVTLGNGMIAADPLFASGTDLHLRSMGGRWDPGSGTWIRDGEHSPCIDTGDPTDPVGGETPPNGGKINMGAYGGTSQASLSAYVGTSFKFR